ncbi:MAG: heavy metal translocating P-type ATPase [Kofleriaceae bacterium]
MSALIAPACVHCGLPIPGGRAGDYCCAGCEIVAAAIAEHGLERYYALRDDARPARTTSASYAELDDPAFQRVHVEATPEGNRHAALYLEDLRCTACVWLVEATPRCIAGVREVRVDLGRSRADVWWDPAAVSLGRIAHHLDRIGHVVHPYRGAEREALRRREDRTLLIKLGIAGAAMGNLMLLAIALYAGMFGGMTAADTTLFRWASLVIALPALGYAATPMFRTAFGSLRAGRLHLDLPLSIGILAGLGWGSANVIRGVGEIYFDSLSMLVFLLLVARWIVLRFQRRASSAAEMLLALTPSRARRIAADGTITELAIEAIAIGDRLAVRAGETIPIDGVIAAGSSAIDSGLLTGESRPVDVGPGQRVHAGTVNVAGPLEVVATAVGEDTRVGALVAKITALATRRAPIERLVDQIAGRFVAIVTIGAALVFAAWSLTSPALGAEHAMALLIVTCPCALALATPLAVTVALGRAARRGILIKGADALERLATPGTLFIDKTGTLTEGRLAIATWLGDLDARPLAAAIEAASAHPIARAFAPTDGTARSTSTSTSSSSSSSSSSSLSSSTGAWVASEVREQLGHGIAGTVGGRRVLVGSPAWVRTRSARDRQLDAWIAEVARRGESPIAVAVDDRIVAVAGLADPIRADARTALAKLAGLGWQVEVLSGDDPRVVTIVGHQLGLDPARCHGAMTPELKLARVEAARARGPVAMVGDGVNDAAAIAAATCGIAVSGAVEIAIEAADVYLRSPSIEAIAVTAASAVATLATIRRGLRISLAYNLTAGTLAALGLIHPLLAALLMPASSLTVLASSLRSRAFVDRSAA